MANWQGVPVKNDAHAKSQSKLHCSTVDSLPRCASIVIHAGNRKSEHLKAHIESSRPDIRIVASMHFESDHTLPDCECEVSRDGEVLGQCYGVTNQTNWIQTAWKLIDVGCRGLHVLPIFDPSHSKRNCIVVHSERLIFVPIYKSAYSSFTEFFRSAFPENFAEQQAGSLNSYIDLRDSQYRSYFKFSVVRDPLARVFSCFMDKYARADGQNRELWQKPLLRLLERNQIEFSEWAALICSIPDTHSDPHWRSQYATLHDASGILVDEVFHLEHLSSSLPRISQKISVPVVLQQFNATHAAPKYSAKIRGMVRARYRHDCEAFGY